jgi:hypothetical protein
MGVSSTCLRDWTSDASYVSAGIMRINFDNDRTIGSSMQLNIMLASLAAVDVLWYVCW